MRVRVDNGLALTAAIIAFLGSLVVQGERLTPVKQLIPGNTRWDHVQEAMQELRQMSGRSKDDKPLGILKKDHPGFDALVESICSHSPQFRKDDVVLVAMNAPVAIASVSLPIIHIVLARDTENGIPVAYASEVQNWINTSRSQWFYDRGFPILTVAFIFGILSRLKFTRSIKSQDAEIADSPVAKSTSQLTAISDNLPK